MCARSFFLLQLYGNIDVFRQVLEVSLEKSSASDSRSMTQLRRPAIDSGYDGSLFMRIMSYG